MPTSTSGPLTGMIATGGKGLKPLGYVTLFSVVDRGVSIRALKYEWRMAGLDEGMLPPEPRPLFLFKRAMREQEGKVRHANGTVTETDVKLVEEDHALCIYQISRVQRDHEKKIINYPKAMRVTFDKGDPNAKKPFAFEPLAEVPTEEVLPMMEAISDYYDEAGRQISGPKVRAMVRNFLRDTPDPQRGILGLSGLNLRGRSGGVYFIAEKHKPVLDKLAVALYNAYKGDAYLYAFPLMDGDDELELVRRHHIDNSLAEAKDAMADVAELLSAERAAALRGDVVQHHWRRLTLMRERNEEAKGILKGRVDEIDLALDTLKGQLERLV